MDEWQTLYPMIRRGCLGLYMYMCMHEYTCPEISEISIVRVKYTIQSVLSEMSQVQSTRFISNSKGLTETLRDIRTST